MRSLAFVKADAAAVTMAVEADVVVDDWPEEPAPLAKLVFAFARIVLRFMAFLEWMNPIAD